MKIVEAPYKKQLKLVGYGNLSAEVITSLQSMGFYPNREITKLHCAPLGTPIALRVGKSHVFALSKDICSQLEVQ